VEVLSPVGARALGHELHDLESRGELPCHEPRGVERRTQVGSRQLVEVNDRLARLERGALRGVEAVVVGAAVRRDDQVAARPDHACQLRAPGVLERRREMREDRKRVDGVQLVVAVGQRRRNAREPGVDEGEVGSRPLHQLRVDVAAVDARAGEPVPVARDAAAAHAEVEQALQPTRVDALALQRAAHDVDAHPPLAQEAVYGGGTGDEHDEPLRRECQAVGAGCRCVLAPAG